MNRRRRARAQDREIAAIVGWPRVLFVAGLPKSGTTWLEDLLGELPGYAKRGFRDSDGCTRDHNVCDEVFATLPSDLLCLLKLHTTASPQNLEVIERHVNRAVIMRRDLRDQCVSRYHDVLNRVGHRHHERYVEASPAEGMRHCIDVTIEHYVPWVRGWLDVLARDSSFMELRYEDLRADPVGSMRRVVDFYGVTLSNEEVAAVVERVRAATRFELDAAMLAAEKTARKGEIGDWRNHFTPEHVEQFKAGAGDLLVELGYERDLSWGVL